MPGTAARARRATCCAADDGSGHGKVTAAAGAAYVARVAFLTTHATSGSVPDAAAATTVPPSTIDVRSGGGLAVWQTLRLLEAIDCDARIFEADVARSMSHATSDVQEVGG